MNITQTVTLKRWGQGGVCLSIDATTRKLLDLEEGTEVEIKLSENSLILKKAPEKESFTLKELLVGMTPENCHAELLAIPLESELPEFKG